MTWRAGMPPDLEPKGAADGFASAAPFSRRAGTGTAPPHPVALSAQWQGATSEITTEDGGTDNVLDYDEQTYWHSDYMRDVYMPQYLIFDLGDEYDLTDVTFLPRQNGSNGDIFEIEVLTADSAETLQEYAANGYQASGDASVINLGTFAFDNNGQTLTGRTSWQQAAFGATPARYVMVKVNHSGGDVQDQYCSASEFRFYGAEHEDAVVVDKAALQELVDKIAQTGDASLLGTIAAVPDIPALRKT